MSHTHCTLWSSSQVRADFQDFEHPRKHRVPGASWKSQLAVVEECRGS